MRKRSQRSVLKPMEISCFTYKSVWKHIWFSGSSVWKTSSAYFLIGSNYFFNRCVQVFRLVLLMSILTIDLGFLGIIEDEDFLLDFNFYISYIFRRFVMLSSTLQLSFSLLHLWSAPRRNNCCYLVCNKF